MDQVQNLQEHHKHDEEYSPNFQIVSCPLNTFTIRCKIIYIWL